MSIQLDPLTGLPVDLTDATFGQIPLDSQPLNLDDLGALGKQSNWLYPDNIIPTLSRLQARNSQSPQTAQDLATDGHHRLLVAGGGGGASAAASYADTSYFDEATLYTFNLGAVPTVLIGCTFSLMWTNYNGPDTPEHVTFDLVGADSGNVLHLGRIAIRYDAGPIGQLPVEFVREWPNGLDVEDLFSTDTDTQIQVLPNTVAFGTLAWTLLVG